MSYRKLALNGVKWTSLSAMISVIIKLIQLAVLAHYLLPEDFGLMAIVTSVIGFSALFLDFGVSAAIVHKQDITDVQLSSLYWLNIAISFLLFFIVFGLAPIISSFYDESELVLIIRLLASTFIISGVGNQFAILLQKELKFRYLAIISTISVMVGFIIAVVLAMSGYGVYSLVYATIFGDLVNSFLNVVLGWSLHRPRFVFRQENIKPMLSFGLFQMGERSINYLTSQFDVLLIGKLLGTEILGIYSIAKNISMKPFQMINPIVNKVTFPILSKVQNDDRHLRKIFLKTINYLCSVNFPVYILIILLADAIVLTFFGEKWSDAIVVLQILAVYRMFTSFGNPIGSLQLAKGRADLGFYWNLGLFVFIPLIIYIGSHWGIVGVAVSLLILQVLLFSPAWYFLVRPLAKVGYWEYMKNVLIPLFIALVGGGLGYFLVFSLDITSFVTRAIISGVAMGVVVLVLNQKYNRDFVEVVGAFLRKKV